MRVPIFSVFAAMLAGFCSAAILPAAAAADKTVWDGVFTSAQATRGGAVYATECSGCHRDGLPERARARGRRRALHGGVGERTA